MTRLQQTQRKRVESVPRLPVDVVAAIAAEAVIKPFIAKIVDLMKQENLYVSQGGRLFYLRQFPLHAPIAAALFRHLRCVYDRFFVVTCSSLKNIILGQDDDPCQLHFIHDFSMTCNYPADTEGKMSNGLSTSKHDNKIMPDMESVKRYISSLSATSTTAQLANHGLVVIRFLSAFVGLKALKIVVIYGVSIG
ncbi:hypothetical protein AgCh_012798 [Apium graveolens]